MSPEQTKRLPDIKNEVPDLLPYLRDGERVISVEYVDSAPVANRPVSSIQALYRLTNSTGHHNVGDNGPSFAAVALHEEEVKKEFHLYEAVFGRDSLRVAINLMDRYPKLALATLKRLAELQGTGHSEHREEEPGKIIHEYRDPDTDPIARELMQLQGWQWPYYGSVDATLEYVRTFTRFVQEVEDGEKLLDEKIVNRNGQEITMRESFLSAVNWITAKMDENPEGLIEYKPQFVGSIENQVWKDSWDSYFHKDGTLANHDKGIASVEVQRIAYDALLDAADVYADCLEDETGSEELVNRANQLRQQILSTFWTDEEGGYFVLGTDRDENDQLRQLRVKTSNMGHLLHSRLLSGDEPEIIEKREAVIRQLFSENMLNCSGIRTLAKDEVRFKPGSYHNGSVWIWDTYHIAQGLEAQGYFQLAKDLEDRIQNIVESTSQFPEFARGDDDPYPSLNTRIIDIWDSIQERVNRIEQPPQQVQAWSVAAVLNMKLHNTNGNKHITQDPRIKQFENDILRQLI